MIRIRSAFKSDSQEITNFQLNMALETENLKLHRLTVKNGVKAVFDNESKGKYYVAELDGKIVGSLLTTYEWSDWRNGSILWIQSVYVEKGHRGKGIYRRLYKHVKELVEHDKTDFRGIRLYVDKSNTSAQKVYEKLGMQNQHYELFEWMNE